MPYVPAENAAKATNRSGGGAVTETGFYACKIQFDSMYDGWTSKHKVQYPTGLTDSVLLNWPYDDAGNTNPRILKATGDDPAAQAKKIQGYSDFLQGVLESCGYTREESAGGYNQDWLSGRTCYTAWVSGDDLDQQYGQTTQFLTKEQHDEQIAAGNTPRIPKPRAKPEAKLEAPPKPPVGAPPKPPTASAGGPPKPPKPPTASAGGPPKPPTTGSPSLPRPPGNAGTVLQ